MAVYDKITVDEYNAIHNDINAIMGTGSGNTGYGQRVLSSPVTVSDRITINEWSALRYDIINAYRHIYNTNPTGVDDKTAGEKIKFNASTEPVTYWNSVVNDINTFRLTHVPSGQRATLSLPTKTWTDTWGYSGNELPNRPGLTATIALQWPTAEDARHFFNAGGYVEITTGRYGGSITPQNSDWSSLLSDVGAFRFSASSPNTDVNPNDGTNWFRCSNVSQKIYTLSGSSPYGANEFEVWASCDVADNTTGTGKRLELVLKWNDDHDPQGIPGTSPTPIPADVIEEGPDYVDGTLFYSTTLYYASGLLTPASAGTFEVQTPTVQVTNDIEINLADYPGSV
jgi:hypothetical protein